MHTLLNRLAATLGQGPFIADAQGKYHLRIDGFSLFLTPRNGEMLLSSPFASQRSNGSDAHDPALLKRLLQQVVVWGRHAPHALVMDEFGNLQLEARLAQEWLDEQLLAERLSQHIALLEQLEPQLTDAALAPQWRQMIWHP